MMKGLPTTCRCCGRELRRFTSRLKGIGEHCLKRKYRKESRTKQLTLSLEEEEESRETTNVSGFTTFTYAPSYISVACTSDGGYIIRYPDGWEYVYDKYGNLIEKRFIP